MNSDVNSTVAERMEKISELFLSAQNDAQKIENIETLISELNKTENEFRSIAYESAAMVLAIKDLENDYTLTNWIQFLEKAGSKYVTQIHVGLGWALAQQNKEQIPYLHKLEPIMQYRVLDGFGFYDSILRKRKTLDQKILPTLITNEMLDGYDQGVGRRIYYFAKGIIETIDKLVHSFPANRQENLWRGVGIACSFVGGCDIDTLQKIFDKGNKEQLMLGAAIVSDARNQCNAMTKDIILICKKWCDLTIAEMLQITNKAKDTINQTEQNAYIAWLDSLLKELSNHKQTENAELITSEIGINKMLSTNH